MKRYGADSAELTVFTFREGLLSTLGHDLMIKANSFSVEVDRATGIFMVRCDAGSLQVVCALREGVELADLLSADDRVEINKNIRDAVLEPDRYPEILFTATELKLDGDAATTVGTLSLHGKTRTITLKAEKIGTQYVGAYRLLLPDYGIRPFSALFGAIRIRPDILIRMSIPAEQDAAS